MPCQKISDSAAYRASLGINSHQMCAKRLNMVRIDLVPLQRRTAIGKNVQAYPGTLRRSIIRIQSLTSPLLSSDHGQYRDADANCNANKRKMRKVAESCKKRLYRLPENVTQRDPYRRPNQRRNGIEQDESRPRKVGRADGDRAGNAQAIDESK